jgi:hypothetical protein
MVTVLTRYRIFAVIALLTIYLPGVISTGIWSDDYPSLVEPNAVQEHASRDGRPLYGFALQFMFDSANTLNNLWYIRFFALIGLLLLNDLVIKILNYSRSDLRVVVASIGAFSIASFQVNVHWATAFLFCWVAYIALLGYTLLVKQSKKKKLIGVLFLTLSSLSYPLLTFFILPIVFLVSYEIEGKVENLKKNAIIAFFGITLSALLALLINLTSLKIRGLSFNDRVSFISIAELPDQIIWFLSRPFILAFRGYSINSPGIIEALGYFLIVNLLIIVGILVKFNRFSKVLIMYLLLIFFTLLSMAPLFFPDQQQVDVRYVTVGAWLISYMLISGAFLVLEKFSVGRHKINRNLVTIIFLILFFSSINTRYFSVIQPIYNKTSAFISSEISTCNEQQILSGVHVLPRESDWPSNEYIGLFSQITDLASYWVPLNAVEVEIRKNPRLNGASVSWTNDVTSGCLVDLNRFEASRQ